MSLCPNLSDPKVKEEFQPLLDKYGEEAAYGIWNRLEAYKQDVRPINRAKAKAWLAERFGENSVSFFDTAMEIGDGFVHGYVQNAGVHLWTSAESGTEYHEAYHLMFRTMLSDEQRQGLYEEATKQFGQPTADEIKNILSLFPEISEVEATKLVLEEKMAEEFREYVLTEEESGKGLLGKIAKWFKDLFNWIKAMFSDNLSLKQTYSLLESKNMKKSLASRGVFRNPQKFAGNDMAYMHRTEYAEQDFTEIKDTLYTIFMDTKKSQGAAFNVSAAMGVEGSKGDIANGMVTRLYKKADGSSVSVAEAQELFAAEDAFNTARTPENIAALKAALQKNGAAPALANNIKLRSAYYDMYKTWNTTLEPTTGNVQKYGWRDILVEKLRDNGLKVTGKDETSYELQKETLGSDEMDAMEHELEILDGVVEKIYGKSQLQDSPAKRLTGQVKELLSTIKMGKPNSYGVDTYMDKELVYREVLELFTGRQTFSDMVIAMENAAVYKPAIINPILDFIKGLDAPQKAMLYNAFALATTEFVLMKSTEVGEGAKAKLRVDVFNPNRKNKAEKLADSWRNAVIATSDPNSRGIYEEKVMTTKEGEEPTLTYTLMDSKVAEIEAAYKILETATKSMPGRGLGDIPMEPGVTHPLVKAVGDVMWAMGLNVGDNMNIQETYDNIHKIVSNGFTTKSSTGGTRQVKPGEAAISELKSKLGALVRAIPGSKTANYIYNNKGKAIEIAEFFAPVLSIAGESMVNASGAQVYATNTQSHLQEIVNDIKSNRSKALEKYMDDPFMGANGNTAFQSILFRYLGNDTFFKEFGIADLDALKESDAFDDAISYEDISKIDSYVVRINAWINGGRKETTRIFIPVQADRDKYTAMTLPRLSANAAKFQHASRPELIKAQIVQDFLRMAEAKRVVIDAINSKDSSAIIDGYHTDPKSGEFTDSDGNFLGRAFDSKFFQFTALDENGKQIVTDQVLVEGTNSISKKSISSVIDNYVANKLSEAEKTDIDTRLNGMVANIDTYIKNQAKKLKEILSEKTVGGDTHLSRIDQYYNPSLNADELLEGFVFEETILRNEIVKVVRGSRAYSKNLVDFYKRMGHLTTPGSKYALKSDNIGSVDWMAGEMYGMMDTFNEITLADLKLNATPEQVKRANAAADKLRDQLAKTLGLEKATQIADTYRPNKFDSTDAQAFISLEMYRGLAQGEGKWGQNEEQAYKAYQTTGEFVYQPGFVPKGYQAGDAVPVYPMKNYFEKLQKIGRSMVPISEKNSYSVLLASYTKDFPQLEDLRQRMEAKGDYQGLKPVHVVNFVSGKKLAKRNVHKVTGQAGEYANTVINVNDSRGLRRPQAIPEMKENPVATLNRQIKKNMMANVKADTIYTYNAGIKGLESSVDGEYLQKIYHSAIEEKMKRDMQSVMDELKISDLQEAVGTKDPQVINKAKLEVLKNIRDIIYKEILDGDLHSNYYKALDIEIEQNGKPRFKVPLDLPIYNKKFESIIMSIMNNRVFKQSMKGYEAVQVAQMGGHAVDDELKFYEVVEHNGKQRLAHAEIMIREDLARKFGIKPGVSLDEVPEELRRIIGYRIPNQDKASTVILKIKGFLPENYAKSIVVPGQLVKLMGSDFDVDKLFLMFPEVEQDPKSPVGIRKVMSNYTDAINNPGKLSTAQLNNIILDSMEAVMSNSAHFAETLSPLDDTTLQDEVDRVRKALPEFDVAQDWNDITTETDALIRNQAGNKLRGVYANIIAGRNVAQHGVVDLHTNYSIKISENGAVTEFRNYQSVTKEGITTDKSGSLFLSAAVDAGKDPIQLELNDSLITAPIRALFMAYHNEYNTATCTNFLNQPYVRMLTGIIENTYGGNTQQITNAKKAVVAAIRAEMKKREEMTKVAVPVNLAAGSVTVPMDAADLSNLSKENRDLTKQLEYVENFALFYRAGKKLLDLYKRITPDSMDGLNRIGNIQSYDDKARAFDSSKDNEDGEGNETMFIGPDANGNVIDQFVGPNSIYGLEKAYEGLKNESLNVASLFFPMRTSAAFLDMKERIKAASGQNGLTSAMHQMVDGSLTFLMLTKPGSPFLNYINEEYAQKMYSNPTDNIGTRLTAAKKDFPKLAFTKFIGGFEIENDVINKYYGVKFDGSQSFSRSEREQFTSTLRAMMFSPQLFLNIPASDVKIVDGVIQDPELKKQADRIKGLGQQLAMHSFLSNGFRQGASSYHDIIPVEFFSVKQNVGGEKRSILDFLHDESDKLANPNYFNAVDLLSFMQLFGPMKAEGRPLLTRKSSKQLNNKTTELKSSTNKPFLVFSNRKTNQIATFVNLGKKDDKYVYGRLKSGFTGKAIYSLPGISGEEIERYEGFVQAITGLTYAKDVRIPQIKDTDNLLICNG